MQNRKNLILGIASLMATIVFVFVFLKSQAQNRAQQDDPPTPIQLGVMNEKQRRNSKLFETPPNSSRKNLITNLRKSPKGFTYIYPGDQNLGVDPQSLPPQTEIIKANTCISDLVLIGKVEGKSSQITEDLRSLFTDYGISVNSVVFNKPNINSNLPSLITVTRLGGSVLVNNARINYVLRSQKQLKTGMTYLLFLKYIPESDTFTTVNRESTFLIDGNRVLRYSDTTPPFKDINENIDFFLNVIRTSANQCS